MSQRWQKFPPEFRRMAVEKMETAGNVAALARELGIQRKWLYKWKKELSGSPPPSAEFLPPVPKPSKGRAPASSPIEEKLRKKIQILESLVARQSQEIDFFKGALQNIEKRQRKNGKISGSASTSKSDG
ncbi:MAG TPA: transposase [Bryobacteraceae bacterium]